MALSAVTLLVLAFAVWWAPIGKAETAIQVSEYELKAAFLFNFARFTEWPAGMLGPAGKPFVIAVLGDDPFGPVLERTVAGKQKDGHPLQVRRFRDASEVTGCHLLFVASSEKAQVTRILQTVSTPGLLTVGETDGFAERGGAIGTVVGSDRLGIVVNTDAVARAGLHVSSKLLAMARLVQDGKRGKQ